MKINKHILLFLLINIAIASAATNEAQQRQFVTNVINHFNLPHSIDLLKKADDFNVQTIEYCQKKNEQQLISLKTAFTTLFLAWKANLSNNWGPAAKLRLERHIDFWPSRVSKLQQLLMSSQIENAFGQSGVAVKGLPAIEWLIYGDEQSQQHPNYCPLMKLLSADISTRIATVNSQWQNIQKNPDQFNTNFVYSPKMIEEYINALTVFIYQTRKRVLITPLGLRTGGIKPERVEGLSSQLSTKALHARIKALSDLLTDSHYGLINFLQQQELTNIAKRLGEHHDKIMTQLSSIDQPINVLLNDNKQLLIDLEQSLNDLQYHLEYDISNALNIVMFFRDMDGD